MELEQNSRSTSKAIAADGVIVSRPIVLVTIGMTRTCIVNCANCWREEIPPGLRMDNIIYDLRLFECAFVSFCTGTEALSQVITRKRCLSAF